MPAPGLSIETTLANERVCRTIEDVTAAWDAVEDAMLGALEYVDIDTPHLADSEARLDVLLHRLEEAERLAHAEVAAARSMVGGEGASAITG
jgi:hypothetical protein